MPQVFWDALVDTAKMIPILLIIYAGIEFFEYKFGSKIREKVRAAGKAGPVLGTAFGVIPQCGFSVISSALYARRLITVGTLIAVYLSTSDEAIPIILAQPDRIGIILPLLAAKIAVAVMAGYTIDFILHRLGKTVTESEICASSGDSSAGELGCNDMEIDETGCCGHNCVEKPNLKEMILHPLIHTLKVFVFIFVVSVIINFTIFRMGENNLDRIFFGHTLLQPIMAAVVGLIPNCAASVAITQVFLKGGIGFGSAVAGLSASAGLGTLVLFKENRDMKDTFRIIGMLFGISSIVGIALQFIYY